MGLDIKGFTGGMDKDISPLKTPANVMHDAFNVRVLTDEGGSSFSIVNTKGNQPLTVTNATDASDGYSRTGYVIVGMQGIREDFIVFWAKDDNSGYGIIDKLIWDGDGTYTRVELYKSTSSITALDFFPHQKLEIEFSYEGEDIIRVYFTNEYYPLRLINIGVEDGKDPKLEASYTSLRNSNPEQFDRVPFINHVTPQFINYGSGSLLTGVYQYAYRLVTKAGTYSSISPASETIATSPKITGSNTAVLAGADSAEKPNSGISISMSIDLSNLDTSNFETLEVMSLYYSAGADTPTIYIIEQIPVLQGVITFTDESAVAKYGTLTYEEFLVSTFDFSAASIAAKDNRLFAANINEKGFDVEFDARAYRFNASGVCKVLNGVAEKTVVRTGTSEPYTYQIDGNVIPEDADTINQTNTDPTKGYLYNTKRTGPSTSGYALGGEGPNVNYTFKYQQYSVVGYADGKVENNSAINATNSPYLLGRKKGFKRGEVYRFGIVFFSVKGVASPVKWIGDIEIPYGVNPENSHIVNEGQAYIVYPDFVVNTAGTQASGLDYQIVYVEKTELNRKIVAEGYLNQVVKEGISDDGNWAAAYYNPAPWRWTLKELFATQGVNLIGDHFAWDLVYSNDYMPTLGNECASDMFVAHNVLCLHAPEQVLLDFNYASGLKVRIDGLMGLQMERTDPNRNEKEFDTGTNLEAFEKPFITDIFDLIPVTQATSYSTLARYNADSIIVSCRNGKISTSKDPYERNWYNAKSIVFSIKDELPNTWLTNVTQDIDNKLAKATIYRDITPYNGETYADRLLNTYIPASDVVKGAALPVADRGDTVITYFDYTRVYWPIDISGSSQGSPVEDRSRGWISSMWFPVESRVNCYLRHDTSYLKGGGGLKSDTDSTIYKYLIQETGNPTGDLYLYDDVYNKPDNSKRYAPIAVDDKVDSIADTKVRYSELKQQGEETDNWSVFKTNNFNYAQTEFGPINRLIEFNNNIYFFQDSGFGLVVINPRVTVSGQDGVETALGTGATLERFNYISTEIGSQANSDIVKSIQAIYWLDSFKKKIYKFTGQLESLSDLKGLSGYLRETITDDSKLRGIYDNEYSDVYMTIANQVYQTAEQDITYQITENQEFYEIQTVQETVDTPPRVEITATTAVSDTSYIELNFNGTTQRFTAGNISTAITGVTDESGIPRFAFTGATVAVGNKVWLSGFTDTTEYNGTRTISATDGTTYFDTEEIEYRGAGTGTFVPVTTSTFLASTTVSDSMTSLYYAILEHITLNNLTAYTVSLVGNVVTVASTLAGSQYNFSPNVFNNVGTFTKASATIAASSINENSTVTLTFTGTQVTFTAKNSPSGATEFQASQTQATTLGSLHTVITTWLTNNSNTDYNVTLNAANVFVEAVTGGTAYDLNAQFFNNVTSSITDADAGGTVGAKDITGGPVSVNYDNSWVIADFSTAGGVDRLDLYKNGSVVAQSNQLQGSNYGMPNLTNIPPYVVGRLSNTGKDYKPGAARELFKSTYSSGTSYDEGDIVESGGSYYVSRRNGNIGQPVTDNLFWWPQPAIRAFNTDNWSSDPSYGRYLHTSAFIGTNTQISQQTPGNGGEASVTGMVPTRYQDYLDDGGLPTEDWLGTDGTNLGSFKIIKGGVVSHYNYEESTSYPIDGRGQRVWAKYNSGDNFEIKCMGAGTNTFYKLTYYVISSSVSDLSVTNVPSAGTPIPSDLAFTNYNSSSTTVNVTKPVLVTKSTTTTYKKKGQVTTITASSNNFGVLTAEVNGDSDYKITSLYDNFRFSKFVEYEIAGAFFEVVSTDYANHTVFLKLLEGTPTTGNIDLTEFLEFRNSFTVSYNEIINKFVSFHDFFPKLYAKGARWFVSSADENGLYEHNNNDFGSFYGTLHDSRFDIVLPKQNVQEYTNLNWVTKITKLSEPLDNETLYSVKAYTQEQESDEMVLYPKSDTRVIEDMEGTRLPNNGITPDPTRPYSELYNISKNANATWRTHTPRIRQEPADSLDLATGTITTDGHEYADRVLGPWAKLRFRFKNSDNKRCVVEDIIITNFETWH